ncbi:MAG TPA: hypothetical protein VMV12_03810 [Candidatus Micrarchaeaceae archaeon]|nr:hypothetical protein [Candidatus Micrarchaeaceae archaeon]
MSFVLFAFVDYYYIAFAAILLAIAATSTPIDDDTLRVVSNGDSAAIAREPARFA